MARRRATSRAAAAGGAHWPGWAILVIGLTLGGLIMWGGEKLLYGKGKPFQGLSSLFESGHAPAHEGRAPQARTQESRKQESGARKPDAKAQTSTRRAADSADDKARHYDFYSMLPGEGRKTATPSGKHPAQEAPAARPASRWLQAGRFRSAEEAERLRARLALLGYEAMTEITGKDADTRHAVRIGPFTSEADVGAARGRLKNEGVATTPYVRSTP